MIRINLLPVRRRRRRLIPESGVVGVVLVVIALLVGSYLYGAWQNHRVEAQTEEINRRLVAIRPKAAQVLALEAKIGELRAREELLRTLEARQLPWSEMLTDLAQRTPRDAWLASASVTGAGTPRLSLQGSAMSYNAVARLMMNLAGSRFYSDVDLQGASGGGKVANTQVVQFGVFTTLRPVEPAAPETPR